ncbi:MAG: PilZ domain-containing protein [Proteobacteria bacterium]|nr:PilZ domain-containing protein [Pseudomonadota bacterium]
MPENKRTNERKEHFGTAILHVGDVCHEGSVFNVSIGGALVALDTEVAEGSVARLEIVGIEVQVPCTVLRDSDLGTHLVFQSVDAASAGEFVALLGQKKER